MTTQALGSVIEHDGFRPRPTLASFSRPLVTSTGSVGWPSRQFTAPMRSPCSSWTRRPLAVSKMKMCPQSEPVT
jgi:hypothetical protein